MNSRHSLRTRFLCSALALAMLSLLWLASLRQQQSATTGRPAVEKPDAAPVAKSRPAAAKPSAGDGSTSSQPALAAAAAAAAVTAPPVTAWSLREDTEPRSHRSSPAKPARRQPLRSAAVRIAPNWLADARAGDAATFDLGAGLIARGVFEWANREALPGVLTFAGTLKEPNGAFHLEHHPLRGWAGSFLLKDTDEMVQLVPDRHEAGVTRLELWPRRETVCASVDEDGDPATPPPADPSIDHTLLQSRPGAPNVIYLDFDGETVSGTQWNVFYNSSSDIHAAPSGMNREEIIAAWARAAEDWAPFNVNVTTRRSIYNATGQESRTMVVCTPSKSWYDNSVGGVATLDSFNNVFVSAICWCFNVDTYVECAETISHEAAHTMGNSHASWESDTGLFEEEYYDGHETDCGIYWAPIMGNSFGKVGTEGLTQFTIDDTYPGSTVGEDQLDEIAYELGQLEDVHFDTLGGVPVPGTMLTLQNDAVKLKGLINHGSDVDAFWIELPAGGWDVKAEPNPNGPNVDVWLELQEQAPSPLFYLLLRRSANSGSTSGDSAKGSLSASVTTPQAAGLYRIRVGSDQCSGTYGYPKYGGVGTYTLTIRRRPGFESAAPVLTGITASGLTVGSKVVTAQINFRDASKFEHFFDSSSQVYLDRVGGGFSLVGVRWGNPAFSTDDSGSAPVFRARQEYRFNAPGGWWDNADTGTYRVRILAGAVSDIWGNANPQLTQTIGTIEPDTAAPVLTGVATPSIVSSGGSQAPSIKITITDQSPILVTGNGAGAFEAISASGGATIPLTRQRYSKSEGGREWTIHLTPTVPVKGWDLDDTSVYNVVAKPGAVRDTEGHIAPAVSITTFTVATTLWSQDFEDTSVNHGFTLATGWQTGFVNGLGGRFDDPAPGTGNDTRLLGYGLGAHSSQYGNDLDARAAATPPIDTQGYEGLTLRYRRWLTLRAGDAGRIEINDGTTNDAWTTIWSSPPDTGFWERGWTLHEIPLPPFVANGTLHVRWIMGATDHAGTAGGWNVDDVEIVAAGTYQPARLTFNPLRQLATAVEGGADATYTVRLNQQPTSTVVVNLAPDAQSTLADNQLVFTTVNWATPQTVTVDAVNDALVEGSHRTVIHHVCLTFDQQFNGVAADRTIGVTDNDSPLILTQPEDATLLPGTSVTLSVTPVRSLSDITYQWFRGVRGNTNSHSRIIGATSSTLSVTLPANATGPALYWVRVNGGGRPAPEEHSRQVTISPLTGFAAFKQRLLQRGYTQAQINAPGFANADPDGNGLSHFVEHAVGIFPGQAPSGLMNVELAPAETGGAGELDLLVTLPPLQPDVLYLIRSSSDLAGWTTVAELTGNPYSDSAPVVRVPSLGSGRLFGQLLVTPLPW